MIPLINTLLLLAALGGLWHLWRFAMATKQELIDGLTSVNTALDKISGETSSLVEKVAELEAALGAAEGIPAEVMTLLDEVKAKVKAVDDLVVDAAPEVPTEPNPPEEPTDPGEIPEVPTDPQAR